MKLKRFIHNLKMVKILFYKLFHHYMNLTLVTILTKIPLEIFTRMELKDINYKYLQDMKMLSRKNL